MSAASRCSHRDTPTMTSLADIIKKSKAAFKAFETTDERLTNFYVTQIYDAIAKIFYPIRYGSVGAKHNLMGMIDNNAAFTTKYGELFPQPSRPGIYASDINTTKDASLDSRKKEDVHKATISDWEIYNAAKSEANRFIVRVVADIWISPFSKGTPTLYTKRMTKELLDQLQVVCKGHPAIYLLALQDKMRTIHVTTYTIPQYIVALEKAQLQSERAGIPIPENYLMMVATKAVLSSEHFPRANEYFEDLDNGYKLWEKWCEIYTKADMKETIRIHAGGKEAE